MAGWTNKGKYRALAVWLQAEAIPGSAFAVALATNGTPPTADSNVLTDCTQIATGNGYSDGGINVARDATDWDVLTEDDTNDRALAQIIDLTWTAAGGPIPSSGAGARWALLTDQNATVNSREIIGYWDLASDRSLVSGQALTLQNCELRLNEV